MNDSQKYELFSQIHTLLDSGMDLARMFEILLSEENTNEKLCGLLSSIYNSIIEGKSFNKSFYDTGKFNDLDINVLRVGEISGNLSYTSAFLAEYYKIKIQRERTIKSALSYPLIIMVLALIVLFFMLIVIVPTFQDVYVRMGGELPRVTQMVLSISDKLPAFLKIIVPTLILTVILIWVNKDSPIIEIIKSHIIIHTPFIGAAFKINIQCTFCRLMALLLKSGFGVLDALELTINSLSIWHYQVIKEDVTTRIKSGNMLSEILSFYPSLFFRKIVIMVNVGEESNRLPQTFSKLADILSEDLDYNFKKMSSLIEPVMVIIVGFIVALILISMYLPMFQMGNIIK